MIPKFTVIRQKQPDQTVADIPFEVRKALSTVNLQNIIKRGMRVAITAGSRGVFQIPLILKTVCEEVRVLGGDPFLIPAMGSHGGGYSSRPD